MKAKDVQITPSGNNPSDVYDDGNIPKEDLKGNAEPLPESTRPRKDGPGGESGI
ncbi:MAG: hypothetical protein J6P60_04750 [Lachnospiraceae bacterium]|nr:hypothetical protein [Lachnospiraceae bacterium]